MPLDLSQVAAQIEGLAAKAKVEEKERGERLERALKLVDAVDVDSLKRKLASSKTSWLVCGLTDGLAQQFKTPPCPESFTVLATDGSHIDVDRHSSVRCYLINIGSALLYYGEDPDAQLSSEPALFFGDDLVLTDPSGRKELIEGTLLGVKRSIAECQALEKTAQELPSDKPTLALIDGSLILWGLAGRDFEEAKGFVREELLDRQYLTTLDRMKHRSETSSFALASYISFPRSTDVVNALRVAICPHDAADCDRYCVRGPQRDCEGVAGIEDSDLFYTLLDYGERSNIFISGSRFMQRHYGEHQINFFYIKLDEEVARVEIPQWIAENEESVNLVHALVLDQCRRGHGYPVALMEAHEKAVVTTADRENFWGLVELYLTDDRVHMKSSGKSKSKRTRWV